MSNYYNEMILERLYDEAYVQILEDNPRAPAENVREYMKFVHSEAVKLAQKRWENYT
jgi:hypothetical protein|tara:strand:+ start:318 stop:488 length:171 start_codon:yes stop_codon:yes gene_type:complete